jgi:hypothetical protein
MEHAKEESSMLLNVSMIVDRWYHKALRNFFVHSLSAISRCTAEKLEKGTDPVQEKSTEKKNQ